MTYEYFPRNSRLGRAARRTTLSQERASRAAEQRFANDAIVERDRLREFVARLEVINADLLAALDELTAFYERDPGRQSVAYAAGRAIHDRARAAIARAKEDQP